MTDTSKVIGKLTGKVALVTGAASGIGKATAQLFLREGAKVAVTDLDGDGALDVLNELRGEEVEGIHYSHDVTSEDDWRRVVDDVLDRWERFDVLVNNAGIADARPLVETSLDQWRKVMSVDLDSVFLGTRFGIEAMRRSGHGGSIVNVSSAAGIKAGAKAAAYCASKAAVRMLTRVAALECAEAQDGIRVNSICPGGVRTPIWEGLDFWETIRENAGGNEEAWEAMTAGIPLGRFSTAEEIARSILFLASDDSAFMTGSDLVIDGGYTA